LIVSAALDLGKQQRADIDYSRQGCDMNCVKNIKAAPEKKTPGTAAVEKHRPLLNKLTEAQRRRLRQRAATLLYGNEATAPRR
jgi:hypothetical protein